MELERRLKKVARYHLALFILPLLSLLYYGWWTAPHLDQRPDNPLRASPMSRRGSILDRSGKPLARSVGENRDYPLKAAAGSLVGYHLRGRNQSGLEALLQTTLSPPPPPKSLWGAIARDRSQQAGGEPLKGPDVTLTLDARLQTELFRILGDRAGAIVVADPRTGDIVAAVSGPSFDPNRVGEKWQELRSDQRSPLIERVGSGLYPVLNSNGDPLLSKEDEKTHPWFSENPFPAFPGASPALLVDERQLLSPLMLVSLMGEEGEATFQPRLLRSTPDGSSPDLPPLPEPELISNEQLGRYRLFRLMGPAFRDSPPFDAVLGRRISGSGLIFALVVEEKIGSDLVLLKPLVKLLENWPLD